MRALVNGVMGEFKDLGYLLWKSGCTWFKNWYFSEGFWEGDIKLQGNTPPDNTNRIRNWRETQNELTKFLKSEKSIDPILMNAQNKAQEILCAIEKELALI